MQIEIGGVFGKSVIVRSNCTLQGRRLTCESETLVQFVYSESCFLLIDCNADDETWKRLRALCLLGAADPPL